MRANSSQMRVNYGLFHMSQPLDLPLLHRIMRSRNTTRFFLPSQTTPPTTTVARPMSSSITPPIPSFRESDIELFGHTSVPLSLLDGHFKCSKCPRVFPGLGQASHHMQTYQHAHTCTVMGCSWSYNLAKDLIRHSKTHNPQPVRYACPVEDCRSRRRGARSTFARPDLLRRHMDNFHR